MSHQDETLVFRCGDAALIGVLSRPATPRSTAVLVVVGGPQTRVGAHRQFVLVARHLADAGYPVLRFDHRGMGDSEGEPVTFDETAPDIAAAVAALLSRCPDVRRVVLWGLCDAASASLLYWHAARDDRIAGLCLLNPWVRAPETLARTHIRHYYGQRLRQPEFWRKLVRGEVGIFAAGTQFLRTWWLARRGSTGTPAIRVPPFPQRMAEALASFPGPTLLILSGDDYTAREFADTAAADGRWQMALNRPSLRRVDFADADHTFSSAAWRGAVETTTRQWLDAVIDPPAAPTPPA